jgi:MFS superfamily sulfate permease-like transporter
MHSGLSSDGAPAEPLARLGFYAERARTASAPATAVSIATVVIIQLWPRLRSRVPGPLVAILATTAAVHALGLDVETIASRFGEVLRSLPMPSIPAIDWAVVPKLVSPAITIALLAAIESLLCAVVADGLIGGWHRSNAELLAQGVANLASPLFGGIPATGAIARTATNVRNGGRTPIAGLVHAATLLAILVAAGPFAGLIPMASLAGVLAVVAYNMSEWHAFARLLRGPRSDVLVLLTTFALTVVIDLSVAIQVGVVLAALLFMRRMAEVTQVRSIRAMLDYEIEDELDPGMRDPPAGVEAFEIHGSFCFGGARKFTETLLAVQITPKVVILRMRHVLAMDATGLKALEDVAERLRGKGTRPAALRRARVAAVRARAERGSRAHRQGAPVRDVRRGRTASARARRRFAARRLDRRDGTFACIERETKRLAAAPYCHSVVRLARTEGELAAPRDAGRAVGLVGGPTLSPAQSRRRHFVHCARRRCVPCGTLRYAGVSAYDAATLVTPGTSLAPDSAAGAMRVRPRRLRVKPDDRGAEG